MIGLNTLVKIIENGLNANAYGFKYKIFADAGTYQKAIANRTTRKKFTNGVLRVGDSSVTPVQGVKVASQEATLEVCVQLPSPETDDELMAKHRAVLDGYFSAYAVQSIQSDGDTYTVSSTYSIANTGVADQRPGTGTSITFYVGISYLYFQNGLNSTDYALTLDGYAIPFLALSKNKQKTIESNPRDSTGRSTSIATAFVRGWDIDTIALKDSPITQLVLSELNGNTLNTRHTLVETVQTSSNGAPTTTTYTVEFGDVSISMQGVDNIGLKFGLTEVFYTT